MSYSTVSEGTQTTQTTSAKLEDQAASAALYATRDSSSTSSPYPVLDEDGKLSSAGAASSLKYARAQDLPSFPSSGLSLSSAGAAATLANNNQKSFQHWKPGSIPAANKAANQAKDYQMDPLWQPELSAAGSKAAVLAHRDQAPVNVYRAPDTEEGHSAAEQALKKKPPGAIYDREVPADAHRKALLAATASMSGSRRRAESAPIAPQKDNSWALKAARGIKPAIAQPFASGDPGFEAARVQNMAKNNLNRQMYSSNPPVAIEVEEQNRQAMLKASAIAMARKMYAIQQTHIEEAKRASGSDGRKAARKMHERSTGDEDSGDEEVKSYPQYYNLEEAARKLAQERLAKMEDEHAEYRQYYGAQTQPTRSKMSMRGLRGKPTIENTRDNDSDEEQSRKIKTQMSIFQSKLDAVDQKKRQSDRDALLVAARKNVDKSMNDMDEKIFGDTGKMSAQQRELWQKTARERAQRESDDRMVHHGQVHIGGGKYLDQAEVDAIARARLQPTLDEISEKAAAQRARDEEIRLDEERRKKEAEAEKVRQAGVKAQEKAARQKEKDELRARLAEEKRVRKVEEDRKKNEAAQEKQRRKTETAAEKERLRLENEEKKKAATETKGGPSYNLLATAGAGEVAAGGAAGTMGAEAAAALKTPETDEPVTAVEDVDAVETLSDKADESDASVEAKHEDVPAAPMTSYYDAATAGGPPAVDVEENKVVSTMPIEQGLPGDEHPAPIATEVVTPSSPPKRDSKVSSWFKSRFRSGSKTEKEKPLTASAAPIAENKTDGIEEEKSQEDSVRDVAMAGRSVTNESDDMYASGGPKDPFTSAEDAPVAVRDRSRSTSISSMSESEYSKDVSTKRHSGIQDDTAQSTISEDPPRGRRGFRDRLLDKKTSQKEPTTEAGGSPSGLEESSHDATTVPAEEPRASHEPEKDDEFEEARDTFEEQKSAPATKTDTNESTAEESTAQKPMSPKTSQGSRFIEDL